MILRKALFVVLAISSFAAGATEYVTQTTLEAVSSYGIRPTEPSANNRDFIIVAPGATWSLHSGGGSMPCRTDGAVLPADNPMLRSVALTAVASGARVDVAIDTTLSTVAGFCQVSVLSILAN